MIHTAIQHNLVNNHGSCYQASKCVSVREGGGVLATLFFHTCCFQRWRINIQTAVHRMFRTPLFVHMAGALQVTLPFKERFDQVNWSEALKWKVAEMTLEEEREDPNEGHKERQRAGGGDYGLLADGPQFGDRHTETDTHSEGQQGSAASACSRSHPQPTGVHRLISWAGMNCGPWWSKLASRPIIKHTL